MKERVRFKLRTNCGEVVLYVDQEDKTVYTEAYPADFCTLKVKRLWKRLDQTSSRELIDYFKDVTSKYKAREYHVSDGIVSVRVEKFDDFANAIWYTISKMKMKEKKSSKF